MTTMKLTENVEIKGYFVYANGFQLETELYKIEDFREVFKGNVEGFRTMFGLTRLGMEGPYTYYLVSIAPSPYEEFFRFIGHCGKGEGAFHLFGGSIIEVFEEVKNGGYDVHYSGSEGFKEYNYNGCLSIVNVDKVISYWILKLKGIVFNSDVIKKNRGEPVIFTKNEKIWNYNYLVWKHGSLEGKTYNKSRLGKEIKKVLEKRYPQI